MPELVFTLKNVPPSKKNGQRIFGNGKFKKVLPSENHERWYQDAWVQLQGLKIKPKEPLKKCFYMQLFFHQPDNRRRDLTNQTQSIEDLIVRFGIIVDDRWQVIPNTHPVCIGIDRDNPHVDVRIVY